MFQNKLVNIMLIILISLTLIGVVTLVIINFVATTEVNGEPTIDEIIENSWETEEITTNLSNNHYVRARFQIHVNSKKSKQELEKRDFQVNHLIIRELAGMTSSELQSKEGIDALETKLEEEINTLLQKGSVVRVYTTERMIQ